MEVRPLSQKAQEALVWPLVVLTAPAWAPLVGIMWLCVQFEKIINPPGWRRVFAWWPVECDPWPDRGYRGWVWLERVWRNPASPGWTKFRREAPTAEQP